MTADREFRLSVALSSLALSVRSVNRVAFESINLSHSIKSFHLFSKTNSI